MYDLIEIQNQRYIHIYACTHAHTYACTHAYTHTHTHTYTHIHKHTHTFNLYHFRQLAYSWRNILYGVFYAAVHVALLNINKFIGSGKVGLGG